jgi:hypothetical protein
MANVPAVRRRMLNAVWDLPVAGLKPLLEKICGASCAMGIGKVRV